MTQPTLNVAPQSVPVNVYRTPEAIVVVAPMPGVDLEDVEVALDGDSLVLRADLRTAAPKDYLVHEWDYGHYERRVPLPEHVTGEPILSLGRGQLAVSLPRAGLRSTP